MARETYKDPSSTIPASRAEAVVPSDAALFEICRALYVGTGGNISLLTAEDSVVVFANVSAGTILPVQTKRVNSTGTTATNIVALY